MGQRRRYSAAEFDRAATICRLSKDSVELARQVLVLGNRQAVVARDAGVARQWVSELVKKMERYIEDANPVPAGWKTDTVTLPLRDWPRVRAIEKEARAALAENAATGKRRKPS